MHITNKSDIILHLQKDGLSKNIKFFDQNEINFLIQQCDIISQNNKIEFYKKQFSDNNISQLNDSLSSLLTEEIKKLAFMSSGNNYLYSIMDNTSTPYLKSYPKRTQLAIGSAALIFLLLNSFFLILFIFRVNLVLKWGLIPIGLK